ncbi:MAG: hypothetical protein AUJ75_02605 [Candidatus Omnitrophica bacterium CG1_02_49_10]|nr:MAG: hypothetical protein AUJ75_02605 [Candidatus Omnitrophica bacterium CG1_02_49_10]
MGFKSTAKRNKEALHFTKDEISGSFGDLGTFIPIFTALVIICGLNPSSILLFSGLFNIASGLLFGIPIAVQPMKAIGTIAISEGLSPNQIYAAGIVTGAVVLFLGVTNLIGPLKKAIPLSVVRGLQLALGLKLLIKGVRMIADTGAFWGYDSIFVGFVCIFMVLSLFFVKRVPGALFIFLAGIALVFFEYPDIAKKLALGFSLPVFSIPSKMDFMGVGFRASAAQIPLTVLNSVIAVCALSRDLFPKRGLSEKKVSISVGLMNLIGCWFGAMPMCHGAGGLAGQYRFGARTGSSVVFLGSLKVVLGLFFGAATLMLLKLYPMSVLGVLLIFSGFELALVARDVAGKADFFVMLITVSSILALSSIAAGFVVGLIFAHLFISGILRFEKVDEKGI